MSASGFYSSRIDFLKRIKLSDLVLEQKTPIAYGGLGNLYRVHAKRTLPGNIQVRKSMLLKTLSQSYSGQEKEEYFRNIDILAGELGQRRDHFYSRLALPLAIVENAKGTSIGFLMREFSQDCTCTLSYQSQGQKKAIQEVKLFLNSPDERLRLGTPVLSREDIFWLLGDFLKTLAMLHERGISVGDLSHSNLIVQHHKNSMRILFLDVDSFSVNGQPHPLGLQTSGLYRAPEELDQTKLENPFAADVYKAGLIVARLLSQINSPATHSYDLDDFSTSRQALEEFGGKTLLALLEKALLPFPSERPAVKLLSKVWNEELEYT